MTNDEKLVDQVLYRMRSRRQEPENWKEALLRQLFLFYKDYGGGLTYSQCQKIFEQDKRLDGENCYEIWYDQQNLDINALTDKARAILLKGE